VAQAAVAFENAWHFRETLDKKKLERELELAANIQANLFPAELPAVAGYELAVRNRPARQCGGDYYDVLPVQGDAAGTRLLLCVADVSGKGLPAALLMSNMQATLRALLGRFPSLADLAAQANELLYATTSAAKYVTAAMLELAPATGVARYVSAGHTDCLLLRASGEVEWLESTGTPLGLLPAGPPYGERRLDLAPGDCLALFSDGVTEAQNGADEEFGEERLADIVRASADAPAGAIVGRIFEAIDAFAGSAPQFDDITLLVLKRL
jgi:sigma-B regulation protein RsbU (phosphoserine phosphatase)